MQYFHVSLGKQCSIITSAMTLGKYLFNLHIFSNECLNIISEICEIYLTPLNT